MLQGSLFFADVEVTNEYRTATVAVNVLRTRTVR